MALKVPGPYQSNQVGELAAVIKAAELTPNYYKLAIVSDSKYIIEGLTKHLPEWEDRGWIGVENAEMFKRAAFLLKSRTAPTTFKWVKGHNGTLGNEESDALAKEGAQKNALDDLALNVPARFNLQGAKLAAMTQAIAYQGITACCKTQPRPAAQLNLELTRTALKAYQGSLETDESIWQSLRKRTIRLKAQQFLYKAMHNTPMVGSIWANIPGYDERGSCGICNTTESMRHILTECEAEPVEAIWNLAKKTWPHNQTHWPAISLGIILGSSCLTPPEDPPEDRDERRWLIKKKGAKRLLQILISEAAHLIWVLRCKRVRCSPY
jgi:ribonuclease HI